MPAKPKNKGGRQNYNWTKIKADYVSDPESSLKKIAEKYGVSLRAVATRSKADDWFATKVKHQEQLCNETALKRTSKKADELAHTIQAASNIADAILKATEDPEQFKRYIVQEGNAESYGSSEYVFEKMDMRAAKDALSALKAVDELLRGFHNIQKAVELQKHQLEREKFEWEKQKDEHAKPDASFVIKTEGFEESWAE